MGGYPFRRQRPILKYIADFVCFELMLIIETDGITHYAEDSQAKDNRRDKELREVGFTTLRFSDWEVLNRLTDDSEIISAWILDFELKHGVVNTERE